MSANEAVQQLGHDLWQWRLDTMLRTSDDIPRVDHDPSWLPEFTSESVGTRRERVAQFTRRWRDIHVADASVPVQVDHRLLGSTLARVTWEFDLLGNWERDAVLLVGQVLGPWFDLLLPDAPLSAARQQGLLGVLEAAPAQVAVARENLQRAGAAPLARAAVNLTGDVEDQLAASIEGLQGRVESGVLASMRGAGVEAAAALGGLRDWLVGAADDMEQVTAVGHDHFVWFLRHVALLPDAPNDLVVAAKREYERAVVWEALESNRHRDVPLPPLPASAAEQVATHARLEQQVREFSETEGLLSQPDTLRQYLTAPMPAALAPLQWLGVTDDLTADARLDQDAVSYTPEPSPTMPYFYAANARDPRLGIIHEGAHYKQLALAWAHDDPIRSRYYDSLPNEGIAFYNEEFMLQAGLFDDAPRSREVVHNFNRLRSLRVIVDVNLATGVWDLDQAVDAFVERVPMDHETALEETASYTANPGHAMTYLVGKQQLVRMQADTILARGESFSLREFHDWVWRNGNLPFSLQRWELLGDRADVDALDEAGPWWE